ncbi:MAG: RNHCP domain-containing protein [Patescibacteria group bacterium]|nr:RNHCP domain-containing protein [Patescibacteria group bacterium]
MPPHTKKVFEDFNCEHCGKFVKGNGRTNHCPNCLWSKHMDDVPGDRSSSCQGPMKPVGVLVKHGEIVKIEHKCEKCDFQRLAPVLPEDNKEELIKISVADIKH